MHGMGLQSSDSSSIVGGMKELATPGLGQNPPPAKTSLRQKSPKITADKNSLPGERVRLHVVITKKKTSYCYCSNKMSLSS